MGMSVRTVFAMAALIGITSVATVFAAAEHRYQSGKCPDGSEWWSVTKYDNGRACEVWGLDCSGINYHRDLHCQNVQADPTEGVHTVTGISNGIEWYARLKFDASNRLTWIGGKDAQGIFYEVHVTYQDPETGDGLQ